MKKKIKEALAAFGKKYYGALWATNPNFLKRKRTISWR